MQVVHNRGRILLPGWVGLCVRLQLVKVLKIVLKKTIQTNK